MRTGPSSSTLTHCAANTHAYRYIYTPLGAILLIVRMSAAVLSAPVGPPPPCAVPRGAHARGRVLAAGRRHTAYIRRFTVGYRILSLPYQSFFICY